MTKKELLNKVDEQWDTINHLRRNITKFEDEIEFLKRVLGEKIRECDELRIQNLKYKKPEPIDVSKYKF